MPRRGFAFDFHTHFAHVGQNTRFDQPYPDPYRAEIPKDEAGDVFGQCFQEEELLVMQIFTQAAAYFAVMYRISYIVGSVAFGQADVQIDRQGLRQAAFPVVNADQGVGLQAVQKDFVHLY